MIIVLILLTAGVLILLLGGSEIRRARDPITAQFGGVIAVSGIVVTGLAGGAVLVRLLIRCSP